MTEEARKLFAERLKPMEKRKKAGEQPER